MIILIDGSHLSHRSFHTFRQLSNSEGYHTGTIYGFFSILLSYAEKFGNKFIVTWEGGDTWRNQIYVGYKRKRNENRDQEEYSIVTQSIQDIKELCTLIGLPQISKPKYEADDILAFLTRKIGENIKILSGDKDLLQLINDDKNISVLRPHPKLGLMEYREETVKEQFGVCVADIPLYLSILGDSSDNIDGIKGYGKVKSAKLINSESEPLNIIEKMFPAEYERIKRNMVMIDLNNTEHRLEKIDMIDWFVSEGDLIRLNRKLFDYQIRAFNSKSLFESLNNLEFQKEIMNRIFYSINL